MLQAQPPPPGDTTWFARAFSRAIDFSSGGNKDEILKTGWLYKKGAVVKNYKKRYFVLKNPGPTLCYFINDKNTRQKGSINLTKDNIIGVSLESSDKRIAGYSFDLVTRDRIYVLSAVSERERLSWEMNVAERIDHLSTLVLMKAADRVYRREEVSAETDEEGRNYIRHYITGFDGLFEDMDLWEEAFIDQLTQGKKVNGEDFGQSPEDVLQTLKPFTAYMMNWGVSSDLTRAFAMAICHSHGLKKQHVKEVQAAVFAAERGREHRESVLSKHNMKAMKKAEKQMKKAEKTAARRKKKAIKIQRKTMRKATRGGSGVKPPGRACKKGRSHTGGEEMGEVADLPQERPECPKRLACRSPDPMHWVEWSHTPSQEEETPPKRPPPRPSAEPGKYTRDDGDGEVDVASVDKPPSARAPTRSEYMGQRGDSKEIDLSS